GGRKVHEIICTNRPVPNGMLGGVRGSDDTYSITQHADAVRPANAAEDADDGGSCLSQLLG
ncbi:hypothetical protein, partial [Faecalibaculum rodentium]